MRAWGPPVKANPYLYVGVMQAAIVTWPYVNDARVWAGGSRSASHDLPVVLALAVPAAGDRLERVGGVRSLPGDPHRLGFPGIFFIVVAHRSTDSVQIWGLEKRRPGSAPSLALPGHTPRGCARCTSMFVTRGSSGPAPGPRRYFRPAFRSNGCSICPVGACPVGGCPVDRRGSTGRPRAACSGRRARPRRSTRSPRHRAWRGDPRRFRTA